MSIILLVKDPFVEAEGRSFTDPKAEQFNIRRPFFGISIKDPRHAFLSIYQDGGNGNLVPISMKDSSAPGGWSNANHNFLLMNVTESRQEKVQIIETFGDHFAFFYGEKPIVLSVQGILLNTMDFNWKNEWFYNYENFLRGTKCVENRARVFLGYDDTLVEGYVLNGQTANSSETPYSVPFSFSLLLAKPPLDLSPAAADEIPSAGANEYVTQAEEARTYVGTASGEVVEYIGSLKGQDGTEENARYAVNPLTGDSEIVSLGGPGAPAGAPWLSERDPAENQWKTEDQALVALSTNLLAQQAGTDATTARLAQRSSPSPLLTRSDDSEALGSVLGEGTSSGMFEGPDPTNFEGFINSLSE